MRKNHSESHKEIVFYQTELLKIKKELEEIRAIIKNIEIRLFSWKGKMTF